MIDLFDKLFGNKTEEYEVEMGSVLEFIRDLKSEDIDQAEIKARDLMEESESLIKELDEALNEVKDYEDRKGIEAVEDVAENFYDSRRKLIRELDLPEDPVKHKESLEEFISDFEDVSRKEEAVMKRIKNQANSLFGAIKDIHEHIEEFDSFIEEDYSPVISVKNIEDQIEEIENTEDKINKLQEEKGDIDIQEAEKEISGLEDQIQRLEESEEWRKKEKIEENLEDLRSERDNIKSELKKQVSKVERPLKKLVYNIESGEVEYEGSIEVLKRMRDQKIDELDSVDLSEAHSLAGENEFIDESQVKKLKEASEGLDDFSDRKDEIKEIESEIRELETEFESLDVGNQKRKLVNKLSSKRKELRNKKMDKDELQDEIEGLQEKRLDLVSDLEERLNNMTRHEIEIRKE